MKSPLKQKSKAARLGLVVLGLLVSAACLYFAFRHVQFDSFLKQIKRLKPEALIAALLLVNAHNFLLAYRWKVMVGSFGPIRFWNAFWSLRLSFFVNASLPARLGEPFRVWYLNRVTHISPGRIVGLMGAERLVDFIVLCSFVYVSALVLGMRGTLPPTSTLLGVSLAVLATFFVLTKLPKASKHRSLNLILQLRAKIFEGIASLKKPSILATAVPMSMAGWILEALILVVFSYGLGSPLSIFKAFMIVAAVNVAIAVPSTPGNIGTFQIGAMTMMAFLGVPKTQSLSLAILYHLIQLVPTIVIGAFGYYFHFLKLPKVSDKTRSELFDKLESPLEESIRETGSSSGR